MIGAKPTMYLRFVEKLKTVNGDSGQITMKSLILQQFWISNADEDEGEWRDVPFADWLNKEKPR